MQQLLESIYEGSNLSFEQANQSFSQLLQGRLDSPQVAAILIALKTKGETVEEIAGAANALRQQAVAFPRNDYSVSDCCGTGGDGLNTINVSSLVSLVAACAGVKMVKHGNRSVSSKSGSADLMEQLGINIHLSPERNKELLEATNFSFLFAPDFHPGVRHVMPIRQSLKTRTIFNLIGPLSNPAMPDVQLLGVYDKSYCKPFAKILQLLGCKKALVVHGSGLDEVAVHGETVAVEVADEKLTEFVITPELLGIETHSLEEIQVDSLQDNVSAARLVLEGKAPAAHIDMVAANCGALLYLNGKSQDLKAGVKQAKELILSGKVLQKVAQIKELSNA